MKLPLHLSIAAHLAGRSGISDAARMNADLLSELVEKTSVMQAHPASSLIYHHGMPSKTVPHWMQGRHVIGYWVCESSEANADYKAAMDAHTQIWTASTASAEALRAIGSTTPVFVAPHAVELPGYHVSRALRDTLVTLFAFSPPMERKNPEAVIRAWRTAFGDVDAWPHARLIIKTRTAPPSLTRLLQVLTESDDRIEIINADLPEAEMRALYDRADIWLSMQRAGAFELHIAQAAAHGLPIITTDVGGPKDYLTTGAAVFVPGVEIQPLQDCELNKAGVWYEPDAEAVVIALRTLAASEKLRLSMGAAARECVREKLSRDVVKAAMLTALEALPPPLPPPPKVVMLMPKHLEPLRPGLDVVGESLRAPGPHVPVVVSHRRSGTHLVGEMISRAWELDCWLKSHEFPERLPAGNPAVYVVRNPIDCLWSTWLWWTNELGQRRAGALNEEVVAALAGYSFADFLAGKIGPVFGFQAFRDGDSRRDNFEVGRGMFYDPIAYWLDHWTEAMAAGLPVIVYEDLIGPGIPWQAQETLERAMGRPSAQPVQRISVPVGLNPSDDHRPGKGLAHWPKKEVKRVKAALTPAMLEIVNRKHLEHWLA